MEQFKENPKKEPVKICSSYCFFGSAASLQQIQNLWIYTRRLVGSTDQACSSGFYFRID